MNRNRGPGVLTWEQWWGITMKVLVKSKSLIPVALDYNRKVVKDGIHIYHVDYDFNACVIENIFGKRIILLGKEYQSLSRYQQQFALMHEIGHIKCNHAFLGRRSIKQECEADLYACQCLQKRYGLNTELIDLFKSINIKASAKEYNARVENIVNFTLL